MGVVLNKVTYPLGLLFDVIIQRGWLKLMRLRYFITYLYSERIIYLFNGKTIIWDLITFLFRCLVDAKGGSSYFRCEPFFNSLFGIFINFLLVR